MTSAEERLLVACVREHDWATPPPHAEELLRVADQDRLVALAVLHRAAGCAAVSLDGCRNLNDAVGAALQQTRRDGVGRHLRVQADLHAVGAAFDGVLPWLVVKGPVLAQHVYARPDLRSFVDLDLLVPPGALGEALTALEDNGFTVLDRNWALLARRLSGELHLRSPHGGVIDLHWDLFNDRRTRDSFAMRTESFFDRSEEIKIDGRPIRTLDPVDTVVHTAVHAARSGGDRLIWMKDLEQLVLRGRFSWHELAERCEEHHARLPVAAMLRRSRDTLSVPGVADDDLRRVGGSRFWHRVTGAVDRLSPVVRAGPDGSLARITARATRADAASTVRELGKRGVARARRQTQERLPDPTWDPSHPESVLYDAGGPRMREEFLRTVAAR